MVWLILMMEYFIEEFVTLFFISMNWREMWVIGDGSRFLERSVVLFCV